LSREGPRNFEMRSDDEGVILAGISSPTLRTSPAGGRLTTRYELWPYLTTRYFAAMGGQSHFSVLGTGFSSPERDAGSFSFC
ncbi:hypothetical protein AVEN_264162-1, partial [Araneus ventricosus]